jgi:hypothetical protein
MFLWWAYNVNVSHHFTTVHFPTMHVTGLMIVPFSLERIGFTACVVLLTLALFLECSIKIMLLQIVLPHYFGS